MLLALVPIALKRLNEWMDVYVQASRVYLAGGDIYRPALSYAYPPFAVLLAAPFTHLETIAARLVFYALNVGAILALAAAAWSLSGGGELRLGARADRREWVIAGLGFITVEPYAANTLAHGQTDLIIDALVTVGCLLVWRGRSLGGSALIGLAAAFKGPPLLFVPYFLARRRLTDVSLAAAIPIGLNLLPDLLRRPPGGGLWLARWVEAYVAPNQNFDAPLGSWASAPIYNQSFAGTLQRWVNTHLAPTPAGLDLATNAVQVPAEPLKAIAYGALALALALTLAVAWRRGPGGGRQRPDQSRGPSFELGAVLALMLLMSPMSGLAHFPALAAPALCVARLAIEGRHWGARAAIALAATAALAANKDIVGYSAYSVVLWSGVVTVATIGLWAVCVAQAWRSRPGLNRPSDNLA